MTVSMGVGEGGYDGTNNNIAIAGEGGYDQEDEGCG
jgi:hypothetical protein